LDLLYLRRRLVEDLIQLMEVYVQFNKVFKLIDRNAA
jgi:hypothetical protein